MTYRNTTTLLLSTLISTASAGCEPKGDLGEYTMSDTGETEAGTGGTGETEATGGTGGTDATGGTGGTDATGGTGGTDATSGTGGTGGTSGTDGTDGTGETGETGETGGLECASELDFQANFTVVLDPALPLEAASFKGSCMVEALKAEGNFVHVVLDCGERTATLDFTVSEEFTPLFLEGDMVALTYHQEMPFWMNQWFVLRRPVGGELLLGGVTADKLLPLADDDQTLFAPVQMVETPDVCATPTGCQDPFQTLALAVTYDQSTRQVVSGNRVTVGMLTAVRVDLSEAVRYIDDDCDIADMPPEWYTALLIMLPEG